MKIFSTIIFCILSVGFFIPIAARSRKQKLSQDQDFFAVLGVCLDDKSEGCVRKVVQDAIIRFSSGVPELKLQPMDPLKLDNLDLNLNNAIKVHFTKGDVRGAKDCKVLSANVVQNRANVDVLCSFVVDGDYQSKGRIMAFNIDGDGHVTIKINDIKISANAAFGTETKNGLTHLVLDDLKINYEYQGVINFDATNLIKSSRIMSNAVVKSVNANWENLAKKFGDPAVKFAVKFISGKVKEFLSEVPANKLKDYMMS